MLVSTFDIAMFECRTKAGPRIYYLPVKSSEETDKLLQEAQQVLYSTRVKNRDDPCCYIIILFLSWLIFIDPYSCNLLLESQFGWGGLFCQVLHSIYHDFCWHFRCVRETTPKVRL